jgi:hypothetical protein
MCVSGSHDQRRHSDRQYHLSTILLLCLLRLLTSTTLLTPCTHEIPLHLPPHLPLRPRTRTHPGQPCAHRRRERRRPIPSLSQDHPHHSTTCPPACLERSLQTPVFLAAAMSALRCRGKGAAEGGRSGYEVKESRDVPRRGCEGVRRSEWFGWVIGEEAV